MSDTEEVVIPSMKKKKDTKPQIAREKLKEKRERLKKEKENSIIEEAKKRLSQEEVDKKLQEEKIKKEEEDKKNKDPTFLLLQKMEMMMSMMKPKEPEPVLEKKKRVVKSKEVQPKTPKPKAVRIKEPKLQKKTPKPTPVQDTVFVGEEESPPQQEIYYENSHPLLNVLASRRNMIGY